MFTNCLICQSSDYEVIYKAKADYFLKSSQEKNILPPQKTLCKSCGLVFQNPMPTPSDIREFYAEGYSSQKNPQTFELTPKFIREKEYRALDQFRWIKTKHPSFFTGFSGKILEIGCATGHLLNLFQKEGWQVQGIEPATSFAHYAKEHHKITVHQTFFEEAELPSSSYDFIVLSHVLEHVADPIHLLRRIKSYLKPQGVVYIEVPNIKGIWRNLDGQLQTTHLFVPSVNILKRLAHEAQFQILVIQEQGRIIRCLLKETSLSQATYVFKKDHYHFMRWRLKLQKASSILFEKVPFLEKIRILFLSNTVTFTLSNLVAVGLSFFSSFIIRKFLGPLAMGLYSEWMLILQYGKFHHLGVLNAFEREIPFYRGKENTLKIENIQQTVFVFIIFNSLLLFILFGILSLFSVEHRLGLIFVGALIGLETFISFYEILFQSYRQFKWLNIFIVLMAVVDAFLKWVLITRGGLYGLLTAMVLTGALTIFLYARGGKRVIQFKISSLQFYWAEWIHLLKMGIPLLLFRILYALSTTMDRLIIIAFWGRWELGLYSVVTMISNCLILLPKFGFRTLFPHILETFGKNENLNQLKHYLIVPNQIFGSLFAVFLGLCVILLPSCIQFFLPEFKESVQASQIITLAAFFSFFIYTWNNLFIVLYKQNTMAVLYGIGALITFLVNFFCISVFQKNIQTIALAMLISQMCFTTLIIIYGYQHYTKKIKEHLKLLLNLYFPVVLIVMAWWGTFFQTGFGSALFQCLIFMCLSVPFMVYAWKKMTTLKKLYV